MRRKLKFGGVTPSDLSAPVIRLCLSAVFGGNAERRRITCGWYKGAPLALLGQAIYGPPWPRDLFEPVADKWLGMDDDYFVAVASAWPCDYKVKDRVVIADGGGTSTFVYMVEEGTRLMLLFGQDKAPMDFTTMVQAMQVKQVVRGLQ